MKKLFLILSLFCCSHVLLAQSNTNPNYQPAPTATDAQLQLAQPANTNPNPQREVIVPVTEAQTAPPISPIPNPQQQSNASYQDNARFYNKDNMPENNSTNTIPSGNGDYQQPGYSNPNNKPSTQ